VTEERKLSDAIEDTTQRVIDILEELSTLLESLHPRRVISALTSRLASAMVNSQTLDLLVSVLLVQFLRALLDEYFDEKIGVYSKKELDKISIPQEIKNMIARELPGLEFGKHFDYDYIPKFDSLKEDMTVLSEIMQVFTQGKQEEYGRQIVECIGRATDKILEEIKEICTELFQTLLNRIREKKSFKVLEETIIEFIKKIHKKIKGWA